MRSGLSHYINKWEEELNIPLLEKSADKSEGAILIINTPPNI